MKEKRILDALELVDEKYIEEASPINQIVRRPTWIRWAALATAACACVAGIILVFMQNGPRNKQQLTNVGGIMREYGNQTVMRSEEAIEWPWEYKTECERYNLIIFMDREYEVKTYGIGMTADRLGDKLGVGKGKGYDAYSGQEFQKDFSVWEIKGVSSEKMIAAEMEGHFYPFMLSEYAPPATLGEFLDDYGLRRNLELTHFSVSQNGNGEMETEYYELAGDDYVWQVLSECREARFVEDDAGGYAGRDRISFTATSEALGAYKRVIYLSSDGYLCTNILNWAYNFYVGEEAAGKITSHAVKNAKQTEMEPYAYSLAGTLTEIGDGYVLVDDSVLCADEKDGMVFKVLTSDLRVSRCIDYQKMEVGSIVVVNFIEPVNVTEGNVVDGTIDMSKGYLNGGTVEVPE